jgi:hypothetical protein
MHEALDSIPNTAKRKKSVLLPDKREKSEEFGLGEDHWVNF